MITLEQHYFDLPAGRILRAFESSRNSRYSFRELSKLGILPPRALGTFASVLGTLARALATLATPAERSEAVTGLTSWIGEQLFPHYHGYRQEWQSGSGQSLQASRPCLLGYSPPPRFIYSCMHRSAPSPKKYSISTSRDNELFFHGVYILDYTVLPEFTDAKAMLKNGDV